MKKKSPSVVHLSNLFLLVIYILSSNCSSSSQDSNQTQEPVQKSGSKDVEQLIAEIDSQMEIKQEEEQEDQQPAPTAPPKEQPQISIEINENVRWWIDYFTNRDRERFGRFLSNGEYYRKTIEDILVENGVPKELYYLALIESGFQSSAYSHAGAAGVWQFISSTGKRYGLHIDYYVDERRDPLRATVSAANYLRDLYRVFQDWYLAMAAYNAGELRILQAIMRGKSRNFWSLVQQKVLPKETMNYIPKYLAAAIIGHHPEKFGFAIDTTRSLPELTMVDVPGPIDLVSVSKVTEIPVEVLKDHNRHLRKQLTPPQIKNYALWVPQNYETKLTNSFSSLQKYTLKNLARYAPEPMLSKVKFHKVKKNQTLSTISRIYGLSINQIKQLNGLRSHRIFVGQRLRVRSDLKSSSYVSQFRYKVRPGDNLATIAEKFGLSIPAIKKLNSLSTNKIYAGQTLIIAKSKI